MIFKLEIECDNAAFKRHGSPRAEVDRILRKLADKISTLHNLTDVLTLRDLNGNLVGAAHSDEVEKEDERDQTTRLRDLVDEGCGLHYGSPEWKAIADREDWANQP
jgi:hypothetical protein